MPDKLQQLRGTVGEEIAKLYLEKIRKWSILGAELPVKGLDSRARLDLVVRNRAGRNVPVEVKFQEYNLEEYGCAFEHVLSKLGRNQTVFAIYQGRLIKLSKPLLFLWYPPSRKIRKVRYYSEVDIIRFDTAIKDLRHKLSGEFPEMIGQRVKKKIVDFVSTETCSLSLQQIQTLRELYTE